MKRSYLLTICSLLFAVFLCGCGSLGSDSVTAPPDSTIIINPSTLTITSLAGDTDFNFTVVVQNQNGVPLGGIEIWISGNFAAPRTPTRYQLCRKTDGIDPVDSSFSAETDDFGEYNFSIIVPAIVDGVPNAFEDDIEVRSGSAFASAHISVSSE